MLLYKHKREIKEDGNMGFWDQAATALAQNSPYGITVVFVLVIFLLIHKASLKQINNMFEKSFEEIKSNNQVALSEMRKTMQLLSKSQK